MTCPLCKAPGRVPNTAERGLVTQDPRTHFGTDLTIEACDACRIAFSTDAGGLQRFIPLDADKRTRQFAGGPVALVTPDPPKEQSA